MNNTKELVIFKPQAAVAQKVADEVFFRHLQGEEGEFLNRTSQTLPALIFRWVLYQDHVLDQMVFQLI